MHDSGSTGTPGLGRPAPPFNGAAFRDFTAQLRYATRWLVLVTPVALLIGSAVALFLWSLGQVSDIQHDDPWLLLLLPVAGIAVGAMYHRWGGDAEGGNNLIMDEIHETGGGVPGRMAPLVLIGTLVTHLFGGSAGREGTAVQMGGSLASTLERLLFSRLPGWFRLDDEDRRVLLQAGVAAGFGAVFGTPITGAVFALEVLAIGRLSYAALVPCLMAALLGDWVTAAWGIQHTAYPKIAVAALGVGHLDLPLLGKVVVAAAAFGFVSTLFAETTHGLGRLFKRLVRQPWLRPAIGGAAVIALTFALGTRDYLGLGVASPDPGAITVLSSFESGGALPWSWALKLAFTAITLSSGFKGGEVTPLFFIGAALGNALAVLLHAPVALFAALGFVAVFAGATNTPLACTIMGVELFGADAAVYIAAAAFLSYLFSGHSGIYVAQRIMTPKGDLDTPLPVRATSGVALRQLHRPLLMPVPAVAPLTANATMPHASPAHSIPVASMTSQPHSELSFPNRADATGPDAVALSSSGEAHHHSLHNQRHQHGHAHVPPHHVHREPVWPATPVGVVRVYLAPHVRRARAGWWARVFGPTLSSEIVLSAKRFGLRHALVLQSRQGFAQHGPIAVDHPEYGATMQTLCVELMDAPAVVEQFCLENLELLSGQHVIFRHAEHWELPMALVTEARHVANSA